jgi:hypothetical protein
MIFFETFQDKATEANDGRHHVVDLVGDSAGQIPNGFDALRLPLVVGRATIVFDIGASADPLYMPF